MRPREEAAPSLGPPRLVQSRTQAGSRLECWTCRELAGRGSALASGFQSQHQAPPLLSRVRATGGEREGSLPRCRQKHRHPQQARCVFMTESEPEPCTEEVS